MSKLQPVRITNFTKVNFKATENSKERLYTRKDMDDLYEKGQRSGFLNGAGISLFSLLIAIGSFCLHGSTKKAENQEFLTDVFKLCQKENINENTIVVTDVNKDGTPDIILNTDDKKASYVLDFQKSSIKELTREEKKELSIE